MILAVDCSKHRESHLEIESIDLLTTDQLLHAALGNIRVLRHEGDGVLWELEVLSNDFEEGTEGEDYHVGNGNIKWRWSEYDPRLPAFLKNFPVLGADGMGVPAEALTRLEVKPNNDTTHEPTEPTGGENNGGGTDDHAE